MANEPYYKLGNAEFLPWLENLINVINANRATLPISADRITALEARRASHLAKLNAQTEAEAAAQSATRDLNDDRKLSNENIAFINTTFKADKAIPRELLIEMGLRVSDGKNSSPPTEPLNLSVVPNTAGYTDLKWEKNGNKSNTIYDIQAQTNGAAEWKHVDSVNATKYRHLDRKVGEQVVYRVRARRAGQESAWSSPSVAYYNG